ncbi:DnaJ domain-containing protein [Herminiimonas glaciei]|uniref:DnaJ domain-containing protein n=1 Tax=Herminiimonas glaciei TaxID=523788 RepID=A0ABW2IAJ2_9BURK
MKTLYQVLGVSGQASSPEIEQAYKTGLAALANGATTLNPEERDIREKVVREAYAILSSPNRRSAYDEKLRNKTRVAELIVESSPFPWMKIVAALLLVVGCLYVYQVQADKAEAELAALEAKKAEAEAERAEQLALAEQARLEQQKLQEQRAIQSKQDFEIAQFRREERLRTERAQKADTQATEKAAATR